MFAVRRSLESSLLPRDQLDLAHQSCRAVASDLMALVDEIADLCYRDPKTEFFRMKSNSTRPDGRGTLPWKALRPSQKFALTDDAVAQLREAFGFDSPLNDVVEDDSILLLSMALMRAFRTRRYGAKDFEHKKAKGEEARGLLIQRLKRIEVELRRVAETAQSLEVSNPVPGLRTRFQVSKLRSAAEPFLGLVDATRTELEESERHAETVFDRSAFNRNTSRDETRLAVLYELVMFWEEQGRKPTVSTNSDGRGKSRGGEFYEFVNLVVGNLTDPSTALNSETFRSDLREVQKRRKGLGGTFIELLEGEGY